MDDPEKTYRWLIRGKKNYRFAIDVLIDEIHKAVDDNNHTLALTLMDDIKYTGDQVGAELERAQIRLECASAAFQLNRFNHVIKELKDAISILEPVKDNSVDNKLFYGTALWMLGNLLWLNPSNRKIAITAWQSCLDIFIKLAWSGFLIEPETDWYRLRCTEMEQAIKNAIITKRPGREKYQYHAKTQSKDPSPSYPKQDPILTRKATLYSGNISHLYVIGEIPAGGFKSSDFAHFSRELIKLDSVMDRFTIGGDLYYLYNLRADKGSEIRLRSSDTYFILLISGDSMNLAGIESCDYVLIQQMEKAENNMDIVAAEIVGIDTEATLKYYIKHDGVIELKPESSNKQLNSFQFTPNFEGEFYIRGVAIGVFKKVILINSGTVKE